MIKLAKTQKLAEIIDYQKEAIVSSTLLEKKAGSVTIFAFDQGQRLSEHTAPFDAVVCVLEGKAKITISGSQNILQQGDMIIMPANEPHAVYAIEKFKMLLIMIKSID